MKARIKKEDKSSGLFMVQGTPPKRKSSHNANFAEWVKFLRGVIEDYVTEEMEQRDITEVKCLMELIGSEAFKSRFGSDDRRTLEKAIDAALNVLLTKELTSELSRILESSITKGIAVETVLKEMENPYYIIQTFGEYSTKSLEASRNILNNFIRKTRIQEEEKEQQREKDSSYYRDVKKFTKGFKFLLEDPLIYVAKTGDRRLTKFSSYEAYEQFSTLRERIILTMKNNNIEDELKVIQKLINSIPNHLQNEDNAEILRQRRNYIIREREMKEETR